MQTSFSGLPTRKSERASPSEIGIPSAQFQTSEEASISKMWSYVRNLDPTKDLVVLTDFTKSWLHQYQAEWPSCAHRRILGFMHKNDFYPGPHSIMDEEWKLLNLIGILKKGTEIEAQTAAEYVIFLRRVVIEVNRHINDCITADYVEYQNGQFRKSYSFDEYWRDRQRIWSQPSTRDHFESGSSQRQASIGSTLPATRATTFHHGLLILSPNPPMSSAPFTPKSSSHFPGHSNGLGTGSLVDLVDYPNRNSRPQFFNSNPSTSRGQNTSETRRTSFGNTPNASIHNPQTPNTSLLLTSTWNNPRQPRSVPHNAKIRVQNPITYPYPSRNSSFPLHHVSVVQKIPTAKPGTQRRGYQSPISISSTSSSLHGDPRSPDSAISPPSKPPTMVSSRSSATSYRSLGLPRSLMPGAVVSQAPLRVLSPPTQFMSSAEDQPHSTDPRIRPLSLTNSNFPAAAPTSSEAPKFRVFLPKGPNQPIDFEESVPSTFLTDCNYVEEFFLACEQKLKSPLQFLDTLILVLIFARNTKLIVRRDWDEGSWAMLKSHLENLFRFAKENGRGEEELKVWVQIGETTVA